MTGMALSMLKPDTLASMGSNQEAPVLRHQRRRVRVLLAVRRTLVRSVFVAAMAWGSAGQALR